MEHLQPVPGRCFLTHPGVLLRTLSRTISLPFCHHLKEESIRKPRKSRCLDHISQRQRVLAHREEKSGVFVGWVGGALRPHGCKSALEVWIPSSVTFRHPPLPPNTFTLTPRHREACPAPSCPWKPGPLGGAVLIFQEKATHSQTSLPRTTPAGNSYVLEGGRLWETACRCLAQKAHT